MVTIAPSSPLSLAFALFEVVLDVKIEVEREGEEGFTFCMTSLSGFDMIVPKGTNPTFKLSTYKGVFVLVLLLQTVFTVVVLSLLSHCGFPVERELKFVDIVYFP